MICLPNIPAVALAGTLFASHAVRNTMWDYGMLLKSAPVFFLGESCVLVFGKGSSAHGDPVVLSGATERMVSEHRVSSLCRSSGPVHTVTSGTK